MVRLDLLEAIFGSGDDLEDFPLDGHFGIKWFHHVIPSGFPPISDSKSPTKPASGKLAPNWVAACGCFVSAICRSSVAILACTWPGQLGNALVLGCNGSHWQLAVTLGNLGSFISSFFWGPVPENEASRLSDYPTIT